MSKYTIVLRKLQNEFYAAMQDYPIFDESYREELNNKIFHACRNREIGFETPELFLEELQEWMDLNMPEYNYLFKSTLIELNPIQRQKIIETLQSKEGFLRKREQGLVQDTSFNRKENGITNVDANQTSETTRTNNLQTETVEDGNTNNTTSDTGNTNQDVFNSDFPQGNLTDKTDSNYYSTGSKTIGNTSNNGTNNTKTDNTTTETETGTITDNGTSNTDSNTTYNNTRDDTGKTTTTDNEKTNYDRDYGHTKEKTGNTDKTDFELISQYRKLFLNVEKQLIKAIQKELFMNIW